VSAEQASLAQGIVPPIFRGETEMTADNDVMRSWIQRRRDKADADKQVDELVNTFLLLIVLGAFGSMIFLTRDYIAKEVDTTISAYVFRPLLGMLLAVAMFVIDLLAHSFVSTADVASIRKEPLFILAFAAGLLSEPAYEIVHERAREALEKYKKHRRSTENS
jgi:hypothetical protein